MRHLPRGHDAPEGVNIQDPVEWPVNGANEPAVGLPAADEVDHGVGSGQWRLVDLPEANGRVGRQVIRQGWQFFAEDIVRTVVWHLVID
jgi:hypothetical protein